MKELMSQGLILIYDNDKSEHNRRQAAQELGRHISAQKGVAYKLSSANSARLGLISDIKPFTKAACVNNNGYFHFYEDNPTPFMKEVAYIGTVRAKRAIDAYEIYTRTNLPRPIYGPGETGQVFMLPTDIRESSKYAWIDDTALTRSEFFKALNISPADWDLPPTLKSKVADAFHRLISDIYDIGVFPVADASFVPTIEHVMSNDTRHPQEIHELIKKHVIPTLTLK